MCLQDELQVLKGKVKEIIEENKLLHEEIKRSAVHEILKEGLEVVEVREICIIWLTSSDSEDKSLIVLVRKLPSDVVDDVVLPDRGLCSSLHFNSVTFDLSRASDSRSRKTLSSDSASII